MPCSTRSSASSRDVRDEVEPDRVLATLLFTDIVDSTARAGRRGDRAWGDLLARHHRLVRTELARFRGHEIDIAGDGMFATFDGPARAVRCASAIVAAVRAARDRGAGRRPHRRDRALRRTASAASRFTSAPGSLAAARPGEVLVSGTVKDIVAGSGIQFQERGEHELAGVPGSWRLFAATARSPVPSDHPLECRQRRPRKRVPLGKISSRSSAFYLAALQRRVRRNDDAQPAYAVEVASAFRVATPYP